MKNIQPATSNVEPPMMIAARSRWMIEGEGRMFSVAQLPPTGSATRKNF